MRRASIAMVLLTCVPLSLALSLKFVQVFSVRVTDSGLSDADTKTLLAAIARARQRCVNDFSDGIVAIEEVVPHRGSASTTRATQAVAALFTSYGVTSQMLFQGEISNTDARLGSIKTAPEVGQVVVEIACTPQG